MVNHSIKRRVRGVAIFVVFLALATTAGMWGKGQMKKTGTTDFKASKQKYDSYRIIHKAHIQISATQLSTAKRLIEGIIADQASKSIEETDTPGQGVYLFVLPKSQLPLITDQLSKVGNITAKSATSDTSFVNIDPTAEAGRLRSYEKELQDLSQVRFPSELQIRRKEALHALISEAKTRLDRLQDVDNVLLYITLSPMKGTDGYVVTLKSLLFAFLKYLGAYTVGVILIYYGTKLIMILLGMLGIKGLSSTGTGYGSYYSNYKSYSDRYGYNHGKKRKTKRIYKEKTKDNEDSKDTP